MSERITIAVLAERVKNYHDDTKADICGVIEQLKQINGRTREHNSRINTLETRQSIVLKIVLAAVGGGGAVSAALLGALKLLGGSW